MTYSVMQSSKYLENNRWEWQVWIDATKTELDQIEEVIWYLHETFPNPIVRKTNRKNKFLLKQIGWGVFLLHAELKLKNNETLELNHQLSLDHAVIKNPPSRGAPKLAASQRNPTKIFLSYGTEDTDLAAKVQKNLQGFGYQVLDMKDCNPAMPYKLAQQKLLRESDLIMGLVTSDVTSPYVLDDLNRAKQSNKRAVALVSNDIKPIGLDSELNQISYSMESDDAALENFFEQVDKL